MLHLIDRPRKFWTTQQLQWYLVFCLLDRNAPYSRVCQAVDALQADYGEYLSLLGRWDARKLRYLADAKWVSSYLTQVGFWSIRAILKESGYPWYNQSTRYLLDWARSKYSHPSYLRSASREGLVRNIKGLGFKLASMYIRNTRQIRDIAVLDRHVCRALHLPFPLNTKIKYEEAETKFLSRARLLGKTPYELDMEFWNRGRRSFS